MTKQVCCLSFLKIRLLSIPFTKSKVMAKYSDGFLQAKSNPRSSFSSMRKNFFILKLGGGESDALGTEADSVSDGFFEVAGFEEFHCKSGSECVAGTGGFDDFFDFFGGVIFSIEIDATIAERFDDFEIRGEFSVEVFFKM